MKFFNICYECNDARDDYSKLLKQKNATDGVFLTGLELMMMNLNGDNNDGGSDFNSS